MFWKRKAESIADPSMPKAGDQWILIGDNNDPWGRKDAKPVLILDAKAGWVRYKIGNVVFTDERMPVDRFIKCYRPFLCASKRKPS